MKLCGLDFETSNNCSGRICAVGAALPDIPCEMLSSLPRHGLADMAEKFSIAFQHHDALEDAETCAKIASQLKIPENLICRFEYSQNA